MQHDTSHKSLRYQPEADDNEPSLQSLERVILMGLGGPHEGRWEMPGPSPHVTPHIGRQLKKSP